MSLPLDGNTAGKVAGAQVLTVTDLGLPTSLASGATATATTFFDTSIPATVLWLGKTASGSVTSVLAVGPSSSSVTFVGGASATFNSSTPTYNTINTSVGNTIVGSRMVDSGTSSSIASGVCTMFVLYVTTVGENHNSVRTGFLATASKLTGDGSGVFNFVPS